ncbi:copia protein [Tanacetum coccineum]
MAKRKIVINMGLWYSNDTDMSLTAYADTDHAGCQDTRCSTSGSAQFLGDKLVSWSFKKQKCTAISIPLYCDNKSAIALCCNNVQHSRAKHIDVRYHFIKEQVDNGIVELYFVRSEYQLADIFTKPLPRDRFNFLIEKLDNGTEFVNQTLREWYENVGITHQTSVARTPQQNGVVERRNQTLVEAARTMLIFSKAPLFL